MVSQSDAGIFALFQDVYQPRVLQPAPGGRFLLAENQDSGTIHVLKIDRRSGKLTATGTVITVPSPVCVRTLAIGKSK